MATPKKSRTVRRRGLGAELSGQERNNPTRYIYKSDSIDAPDRYPSGVPVSPFDSAYDTARYIEELTSELRGLADRTGFPFLAYLLDIAAEEAKSRCEIVRDLRCPGQSQRAK